MALKDFKLIQSGDEDIQKVQSNLRSFFNQFNGVILSGNLLEKIGTPGNLVDIVIQTTTTLVPHGLGRSFSGWHLVDIQGDARVWRDTSSTADNERFLPLRASAQVTVKLWVF